MAYLALLFGRNVYSVTMSLNLDLLRREIAQIKGQLKLSVAILIGYDRVVK